jgi:hypothetical protein
MATAAPIRRVGAITYDPRVGRYRVRGGFVSKAYVLQTLERQIEATRGAMRADAEGLQAGRLSLVEWELAMRRHVKSAHLLAASLERGGFAQMTRADLGWTGQRVRRQFEYLRNFAREIESGKQPLDGRLLARVDLYAEAARATEREMAARMAVQGGATHRARQLGIADHCRKGRGRPGCIEQARLGYLPIGDKRHVEIGGCRCGTRCKCRWVFETRGNA